MDTNQILKLADELNLPVPVKGFVAEQAAVLPLDDFSSLISQLTDPGCAEQAQKQLARLLKPWEGDTGMAQLTVMLTAALHTREKYMENNLSDEIYLDTMGCFSRFLQETRRNTGEWVFDRAFWTWRQTSGRLFRLGTLEFEYCHINDVTSKELFSKEDMAISVHIPSDARLTEKNLTAAYQNMTHFFTEHANTVCYLGRPKAVLCSSWLLSPELSGMLGPESGIRRFASGYELLEADFDQEDCYQWLFEGVKELRRLPEKTSLQRAVKGHLLKGGRIGVGTGLLKDGALLL